MPSPQKGVKKGANPWMLCDTCHANVACKDTDAHTLECPPNLKQISHNFILNGQLYGTVDSKINEDIKGLTPHDKDNMVFLSQSVIQLCNLSIGDYAIIEKHDLNIIATVWPTCEKTLASVLFTKNCLDLSMMHINDFVKVSRINESVCVATNVTIVILNAPKAIELSIELQNRLHKLHIDRIVCVGNVLSILFYGKLLKFAIKSIDGVEVCPEYDSIHHQGNLFNAFANLSCEEKCARLFIIKDKTSFKLFKNESEFIKEVKNTEDPFLKIGGLTEEINELNALINCVLHQTITGFKLTKGVLLYGNSGTGKTLLSNALAKKAGVNVVQINSADLYSKHSVNVEETIKNMFASAIELAPSIILLDEVDILCPLRGSRMTESEKRVVSTILTWLDHINLMDDARIFVLATSNKVDSIDGAFRRAGRFECEIEIPVPNPLARLDILKKILISMPNEIEVELIKEIANTTHGFVGADLIALASNAAVNATKKHKKIVEFEDFKFALTKVCPSAMREVQIEIPNVKWADIGGQNNLKLILRQCVEWPIKHADCFVRMGITPPRGVLMYGPPGCSKTMIAKALANESGLNFLSIKGPELFSKWVGESERAVREVFRKARQVAPSIVFFDEIDALGGERSAGGSSTSVQERVLAQLLTELDGVTPLGDVTVLAATNRPDRIDKALLRPGRLDRIVHVPLPSEQTRRDIFRIKLRKMPVIGVDVDELVSKTVKYSGAEVNAVCHEAAMMALEEDLNATSVGMRHFVKALDLITPRTPDSLLQIYEDYQLNK